MSMKSRRLQRPQLGPSSPFYTASGSQRNDAGLSLTIPFGKTLFGGELVFVFTSTVCYVGTAPNSSVPTISGRAMTSSPHQPGAGATLGLISWRGVGVAGDTGIVITTAAAADANHYQGAVVIVVNSSLYNPVPEAGGISFNKANPSSVTKTFPTVPANGLAVIGMHAAGSGDITSGTLPTITAGAVDATVSLLYGSALQLGIMMAVSLSTATFNIAAGAPANQENGALETYAHL